MSIHIINILLKRIQITLVVLSSLFFSYSVEGQNNTIDSLEQLVQRSVDDTIKFQALIDLSNIIRHSDLDKSITYANKLLRLSKEAEDDSYIGLAYNLLAIRYRYKNYELDTILTTSQKSLEFAEKANNKSVQAMVYNTMALAHKKFGQTEKAFSLYQHSFTLFDATGNKTLALRALGNMAILLQENEDIDDAKNTYLRAINYAEEVDDELMASQLSHYLSEILIEKNQIDSALLLLDDALEVNRAANNKYFEVLILANLGRANMKQEQYEIAYDYLQEGYGVAKELENLHCLGVVLTALAEYHEATKNYSKTIEIAQEALAILGENGDIKIRSKFYEKLSDSYEAEGNYPLALKNQKLYHTFSDSLYNITKALQINNLKVEYEVNQKEIENKLLKAEKAIDSKTIRDRSIIAAILIFALIVALGWITLIYKSNIEKEKLNELLEIKVQERTSALQQANYELRTFNHIASHDIKEPIRVISGYVGLIKRKLSAETRDNLSEYFDTIKRNAQRLYTLVEDFAQYTMMSKEDTVDKRDVDLKYISNSVVESLQESIQKYQGQVIITEEPIPIIESSASLIFMMLKNIIGNGLKYNQSEIPTVHVDYKQTELYHEIIISDNGIGIEKEYHEKVFEMFKRLHNRGEYEGSGVGLAIVQLCINKLDGRVNLESEKGKGSIFTIQLPIS